MVICPVRGTYNHVSIFLCRTEKAFRRPSRATFSIAKFPYLFMQNFLAHPEMSISFANLSFGDMYNQRYMHVTTRLTWLEFDSFNNIFSWHSMGKGCLVVITANSYTVSFGLFLRL